HGHPPRRGAGRPDRRRGGAAHDPVRPPAPLRRRGPREGGRGRRHPGRRARAAAQVAPPGRRRAPPVASASPSEPLWHSSTTSANTEATGMNLQPLEDRIVVRPGESEERTASGLVIPDTAEEKPQQGEVLAVGEGRWDESGSKRVPMDVKVGDTVVY